MKYDLSSFSNLNQAEAAFLANSAPRHTARGREEDALLLYANINHPNTFAGEGFQKVLEGMASQFYRTSGSVTLALRSAMEFANALLVKENRTLAEGEARKTSGVLMAVIHHDAWFFAQAGPAQFLLVQDGKSQLFFDAELEARGLGLAESTAMRFFQSDLASGDVLLFSQSFPAVWSGAEGLPAEPLQLWSALNDLKEASDPAAVVQITAGEGTMRHAALVLARGPVALSSFEGQPQSTPEPRNKTALLPAEPVEQPSGQTSEPDSNEKASSASAETSLVRKLFGTIPVRPEEPLSEAAPEPQIAELADTSQTEIPPIEPSAAEIQPDFPPPAGIPPNEISSAAPGGAPSAAVEPDPLSEANKGKPTEWQKVRTETLRGVGNAAGWLNKVTEKAGTRLKPQSAMNGEVSSPLSNATKMIIAILVPLLIVAAATAIYLTQGQADQYNYLIAQANAAADNAALMPSVETQREGWNQTLLWLNQASAYRQTAEIQSLRARAQNALDVLDGAVRLVYKPAFASSQSQDLTITKIIPLNNDLYILDGNGGRVLHFTLTNSGYAADAGFQCGAGVTEGGVNVGALVGMAAIPINNPAKAPILAIDSKGNILLCAVSKPPTGVALIPPDSGWGKIQDVTFDSGRLMVLDTENNALWIYRGFSSLFNQPPDSYFGNLPVKLQSAVGLAVGGDELFLLYADNHTSHCVASNVSGEIECQDPYLFHDGRAGVPAADFSQLKFDRLAYSPPPDPSIYYLDGSRKELYQFSLQLNLNRVLRAGGEGFSLPSEAANAFAVSPSRTVFLAFGNQLFYAILP